MADLQNATIKIESTEDLGVGKSGKLRPLTVNVDPKEKGIKYKLWKTRKIWEKNEDGSIKKDADGKGIPQKDAEGKILEENSVAYQFIMDNQGGGGKTVEVGYEASMNDYDFKNKEGKRIQGTAEERFIKAIRLPEGESEAEAPQMYPEEEIAVIEPEVGGHVEEVNPDKLGF